VILAEDIGGWLLAGMLVTAGLASALLALLALIPASRGNRSAAIFMTAPALLAAVAVTLFVIGNMIRDHVRGSDTGTLSDAFFSWLIFVGPPLLTGGIATLVIWAKCPRTRNSPPAVLRTICSRMKNANNKFLIFCLT
jgi:hypothetical protein